MQYLGFVHRVLEAVIALHDDPGAPVYKAVENVTERLGVELNGTTLQSVHETLSDLGRIGFVEMRSRGSDVRLTQHSRLVREGRRALTDAWPAITRLPLDHEQAALLRAVVALSERELDGVVRMERVSTNQAMPGKENDVAHGVLLYRLAESLEQLGLVEQPLRETGYYPWLRPTYAAVVHATQEAASEWQGRLPELVDRWETTSVEFKEALPLKSKTDKAEFVKDVVALANTNASPPHLLIVGFSEVSRSFTTMLDPGITSDHLENILNEYAEPPPVFRLHRVPWASSAVVIIEVERDRARLPYRLRRNVGKLRQGEVYIRRGTHVHHASDAEIAALEEESAALFELADM